MSDSLVLVTGASGFVASHVILQLQEQGHRVRSTVRDISNEKKVKPVKELCPSAKYPLELVQADLNDADSWPKAVEGCTYVLHVASPFPASNPKKAEEIIKPAVDGTLNVLKACAAAGTVKRVVLTSSLVTIGVAGSKEDSTTFNEEDWMPESHVMESFYMRSKLLAEKAAWKFMEELPEGKKFELAVVHPGLVLGPVLYGSAGTSADLIKQLLEREVPVVVGLSFVLADVRDVAAAHIKCMTVPEAAGHRHLIISENYWMKEIAEILEKEFKSQGYRVPTKEMWKPVAHMMSHFNTQLKIGLKYSSKKATYDNTRMRTVLGIDPISGEKSVIDLAYSMIKTGIVKKTRQYKGPE